MSSDKSKTDKDLEGLMLDLNFVPEWARKQPDAKEQWEGRGDRKERSPRGGGRGGNNPRGQGGRGQGQGGQGRGGPRGQGGPRGGGNPRGGPRRDARPPRVERAPVRIAFIPDRDRLGKVIKLIRHTKRAYAFREIAERFMTNPDFFLVKITMMDGDKSEGLSLYQCKADQMVFLSETACREHAISASLKNLFVQEEIEVDAPTGNFPCVARCSLGGELLGPPNFHGYQAAVTELRLNKYPKFDEEGFKRKIEMVREEEVIEEWKKSKSLQIQYRLKSGPEDAPLVSRQDAELLVRRELLDKQVIKLQKAIMPGSLLKQFSDERLARSVRDAHFREKTNLFSMSLALRPAMKHMHLVMFRTGKDQNFVTAIPPTPLKAQAVEEINHTLKFLEANPGCNRAALLEELCPGKTEDSPEAVHHASSLRWLVDRGHVIEFYDGALAIPR